MAEKKFDKLIAGSSFGTATVRRIRARTPPEVVADITARLRGGNSGGRVSTRRVSTSIQGQKDEKK